jgi:Ca2+-transporting ATPase
MSNMHYGDEITARTHVLSFLVFAKLFRSFASRSETKPYFQLGARSNLYHLAAQAIPVDFQIFLHHNTMFQKIFDVKSLHWGECIVILALTLIPVTAVEIRKIVRGKLHAQKISEVTP